MNSEQLTVKEIRIYNALGVIVNNKWLMVNGQSATIDVSKLASGIYFLEAITDKGIVRKKVVKE